jgi:hypothetical protein
MLAGNSGEGNGELGFIKPAQLVLAVLQPHLLGRFYWGIQVLHRPVTCKIGDRFLIMKVRSCGWPPLARKKRYGREM